MANISLKDRIVFITGASAGIGAACVRAFAAEGARLLLAARRVDRLKAMEVDLLEAGAAAVHAVALDVQDRGAVEQAIAGLPAEWNAIDVLVNNAGLSRGLDKLWEGKTQDWEDMIDTNVKGLLWVTRAVVPGMLARGRGHIVNLGSTAQDQRRPAHRPAGHAIARDQRGARHGGDGIQRSTFPRRQGTRHEGLPEHHAARA
jgi:NADP-dependent 3-hydroxy acid dehydrogenase YdfG